ncbi:hypothetical protein L218DRAFT_885423 [Marasmius fiardii PR-910]|nr:hypothetical protein L218DRAFT_885423 [Marasmius fiardii PR-910]
MSSSLGNKRKASEEDPRSPKRRFQVTQVSQQGLLSFLDLTSVSSEKEIHERFERIAECLLSGSFHLVIARHDPPEEVSYELLEIEFYLWKSGCHEDPFTHGSEEQRVSGQWYFHRAPRRSADASRSLTDPTSYRGGTRKGLDLTLGGPPVDSMRIPAVNTAVSPYFADSSTSSSSTKLKPSPTEPTETPPGQELRGGILLRSIRRHDDGKVISGPSLLVDEILKQSSNPGSETLSIPELVDRRWGGNLSAFRALESSAQPLQKSTVMFLRAVETIHSKTRITPPLHKSPRIGLELSHPGTLAVPSHPRVVFLNRRYRYIVHPTLLTAKGRGQTFLGILDSVISENSNTVQVGRKRVETVSKKKISQLTGFPAATVENYMNDFLDGYDHGKLKSFVGAAGKGASSSPATYLRMMGTIAKLIDG